MPLSYVSSERGCGTCVKPEICASAAASTRVGSWLLISCVATGSKNLMTPDSTCGNRTQATAISRKRSAAKVQQQQPQPPQQQPDATAAAAALGPTTPCSSRNSCHSRSLDTSGTQAIPGAAADGTTMAMPVLHLAPGLGSGRHMAGPMQPARAPAHPAHLVKRRQHVAGRLGHHLLWRRWAVHLCTLCFSLAQDLAHAARLTCGEEDGSSALQQAGKPRSPSQQLVAGALCGHASPGAAGHVRLTELAALRLVGHPGLCTHGVYMQPLQLVHPRRAHAAFAACAPTACTCSLRSTGTPGAHMQPFQLEHPGCAHAAFAARAPREFDCVHACVSSLPSPAFLAACTRRGQG
eukprot:364268-Chlamydomonas_euryale.AAC.12